MTCYARFLLIFDHFFMTLWKYNLNKKCNWSISTQGQRLKVTVQQRDHLNWDKVLNNSQHDHTSFLKTPGLLVRLGFEATTSCSADQCSPNCANRAAFSSRVIHWLLISSWTCLLFSSSTWGFTPSTERNISKHYFIDSVLEARTNVTRKKDRILLKYW